MKNWRIIYRLPGFAWLVMSHVARAAWARYVYPRTLEAAYGVFQRWAIKSSKLLNIQIEQSGTVPHEGALLMGNHRSYIDIAIFPYFRPCSVVAKKSIHSWPFIGWGGDLVNCLWVDRRSPESRRKTRQEMRERLKAGKSMVIFPEGTTTKAPELLPLRPGMFFTAAEEGFPIVPVALEYRHADDAWIGKDLFIPHFIQCFGKEKTEVRVRFGPVMYGEEGEAFRGEVEKWMKDTLAELRDGWV
ncbi:MAG: lysophospholipid acyltransferase family protein, partial [Bacteroidota bacterium]